jgi:hypothetical protein
MKRSATISLLLLSALCACSKPPQSSVAPANATAATATENDQPTNADFIGRVWISTSPGSARGSILVFLPDRTLLMDSCFETFRLSQWGVAGNHIRWLEDSIPIEAEVSLPNKNELRLRIAGQDREQAYVAASVPYVCPDMPR